jgi:GT2 family glycosyltransferase
LADIAEIHAQGGQAMSTVDIIIPVYDGYAETIACLRSVLAARNDSPHEIIVIYDAGPNQELFEYLDGVASRGLITLLLNRVNVGFVATVNKGMALHLDRDVVLLNSDTEVADHWLDRMVACAESDRRIATVTPFSNNAEICSFPRFCQANPLPAGWDTSRLDAIFAESVTPAAIDVPTGVGFCMFIARRALEDVGYFNEKLFGRGYGEENDFCRRLAARRWRNVMCTNVFVAHHGGVSFGAEKAERVANAMTALDRLYPDYHRLVHEFIRADAPAIYRLQAQLAMLDQRRPRILMITHNLDGGTAKHVKELADHLADQAVVFIARMYSPVQVCLSLLADGNSPELHFRWPLHERQFIDALDALGIGRIHIHHIKAAEPMVECLLKNTDIPFDITLHDYYLINGNPALADKTGRFCSDMESRDALCALHSPVPMNMTADAWRRFTGGLLERAHRVFAPSRYVAALFADYFPELDIKVLPHPDWEVDAPYPTVQRRALSPEKKLVVVALGALGVEKGADILERAAFLATKFDYAIEVHLLGYAYRELNEKLVVVHGAYEDSQLDEALAAIDPHLVWFPCQWPETYSYTLSACLRGGYPVLAPGLGAFTERLEGRPLSWLQEFPCTPKQWLERISDLRETVFLGEAGAEAWNGQPPLADAPLSYRAGYVLPAPAPRLAQPKELFELLRQLPTAAQFSASNSRRESLLRLLLRLRQAPIVRGCMRLVPLSFQRKVKRSLSTRALHQIARDLL